MASSSIVIKVKFGETLRRFSASINDRKLVLDIFALRAKIRSLFNFTPDVDFTLTYVDEDGDAVTLADDDDLRDVVGQSLNPLRITITLKNGNPGVSNSTPTPTPLRSPQPQIPLGSIPNVFSEFLKSMPEPLRDQITKLPLDLASKATSSTPVVSELVEKMTSAFLNQMSESMATQRAHTPSGEASTVKNSNPEAAESSNSKNKEKVEKTSEGVKFKDVQPPKPVDLNFPYFDYEAFPASVEGYNGKSSVEKNKDTTDKDSGWAQGTLNASNQCPFSGIPLPNESYHHPSRGHGHGHGHGHHHWKRYGHGNGLSSLVFHRGVCCDGCGVHPITGPRFKSKVKEDYDLCSDCFAGMGNVSDYIRMDRPINAVRHHMPFRGFHDPSSVRIPTPTLPHALRAPGSKLPRSKLDSRFILDVNVLDGTIMAPFTAFTKIWRMRNNGTVIWPCGSQLQWIGGDRLSNSVSVDIEIPSDGLAVEQELDIAVDFNAPELPGRYISYWRMASPSGQKFGQRVWVLIQVDSTIKDINLNLPPVKMNNPPPPPPLSLPHPEPTEVVTEDTSLSLTNNMMKLNDSTEADNQDMNFPINDTLIITSNGTDATTVSPPVGPSVFRSAEVETALGIIPTEPPAMYPTVDLSQVPVVIGGATASPVEEESLLVELEAMGFKQMELNKEVLRMNNYDLEKSVDDLCGVSEWDPMLEELQEMGFVDEEANRRLLKKNNGSIKRVVMDLINGERA